MVGFIAYDIPYIGPLTKKRVDEVADRRGLEPLANRLVGGYFVQLSYRSAADLSEPQ